MATTEELIADARCIDCGIPDGQKLAVLIWLTATAGGMSTDPATLMENARCIDACIPKGMLMAVLVSLQSQISGGGASRVTCGTADPVDPPVNGCGIYYRTDTGAFFLWDGAQWVFKV